MGYWSFADWIPILPMFFVKKVIPMYHAEKTFELSECQATVLVVGWC